MTEAGDPSVYIVWAAMVVLGYLIGSVPFGLLLTRLGGMGDVRNIGSGNIGATNVLRTGRKDLAAATLLLDGGKAALAFFLGAYFFGQDAGLIAGAAAFLGHCFPVWLGFKGGKGVATFFGLMLAAMFPVGVLCAIIWLGMAYAFRFSSLAALFAAVAAPLLALILRQSDIAVLVAVFLAVLIFWRHAANIKRLVSGTEPKIGAGKAAKATESAAV